MKIYLFLLAALVSSQPVFGQTADTTFLSISQEPGSLDKQRFIDQYDYVFGTQQPTRLLAKVNLVPLLLPLGEYALDEDPIQYSGISGGFYNTSKVEVGLEWKALPALSLQVIGIIPARGSSYFKGRYLGGGLQAAARWYYDMPRRIRNGQSANNVSGNYISAEYQTYAHRDDDREPADYYSWLQFQSTGLRYGMQRRLFRYGFADISVGAGYHWAKEQWKNEAQARRVSEEGLFFETRVAIGLALGSPRSSKTNMPICDVLRCFQEDRHLWKAGLARVLRANQSGISSNPKASYEQKLGTSAFSVETEGELFLSTYGDYLEEGLKVKKYGVGINVQPRWYFLQKRRIAKGKSGNNLSGVFAGMMGGYRRTAYVPSWSAYNQHSNSFYLAPHLGVQHRVFRNGFVNFKFGLLYDLAFSGRYNSVDPSSFLSEVQVGFVL